MTLAEKRPYLVDVELRIAIGIGYRSVNVFFRISPDIDLFHVLFP